MIGLWFVMYIFQGYWPSVPYNLPGRKFSVLNDLFWKIKFYIYKLQKEIVACLCVHLELPWKIENINVLSVECISNEYFCFNFHGYSYFYGYICTLRSRGLSTHLLILEKSGRFHDVVLCLLFILVRGINLCFALHSFSDFGFLFGSFSLVFCFLQGIGESCAW